MNHGSQKYVSMDVVKQMTRLFSLNFNDTSIRIIKKRKGGDSQTLLAGVV